MLGSSSSPFSFPGCRAATGWLRCLSSHQPPHIRVWMRAAWGSCTPLAPSRRVGPSVPPQTLQHPIHVTKAEGEEVWSTLQSCFGPVTKGNLPLSFLPSCSEDAHNAVFISMSFSSRCELEQIRSSCFISKCPLGIPSADTLQNIMMTF